MPIKLDPEAHQTYRTSHVSHSILGTLFASGQDADSEGTSDVGTELYRDAHRLKHKHQLSQNTLRPQQGLLRQSEEAGMSDVGHRTPPRCPAPATCTAAVKQFLFCFVFLHTSRTSNSLTGSF